MHVLLTVLVLAGIYLLACQIWPYTACPRCSGGKKPSPSGKAWRACSKCGGTGRKRRFCANKH